MAAVWVFAVPAAPVVPLAAGALGGAIPPLVSAADGGAMPPEPVVAVPLLPSAGAGTGEERGAGMPGRARWVQYH